MCQAKAYAFARWRSAETSRDPMVPRASIATTWRKPRQKPGFCLGCCRVESSRNDLETQRTPGGSLGVYLVKVGFWSGNGNMPVTPAPRVTDCSVGKISFKCNNRQSHIVGFFPTPGGRGGKVGMGGRRPGPRPVGLDFTWQKPGRQRPGADPPSTWRKPGGPAFTWLSPGGQAKRDAGNHSKYLANA